MENIITCMNFKIDKVVFFGYHEQIQKQKTRTENFLKEHCGVQCVVFHSLSQNDLQSVLANMRKEIEFEKSQKNQVYFDVTGGESLILVAFGMLSKEFDTPMHIYDVEKDRLIVLNEGTKKCISRDVPIRKIPMDLDLLVNIHGGKINYNLQKHIKGIENPEFTQDVEKIYRVAMRNWEYWNPFATFLRNTMEPVTNLQVSKKDYVVWDALISSNTKLNTINKLNELLDELAGIGVLLDVEHDNGLYQFTYKNREIKDCLGEGGSILELHTSIVESKRSDECQVGVHLDWDGVIHQQSGIDVVNEIDVLSLQGNIPTFISCKSGKMGAQQILHALYELETVAGRFGGKYAKKILITAQGLGDVYVQRASEMNIRCVVAAKDEEYPE